MKFVGGLIFFIACILLIIEAYNTFHQQKKKKQKQWIPILSDIIFATATGMMAIFLLWLSFYKK